MKQSKRKSKNKTGKIVNDVSEFIDCSPDLPQFIQVDIKEESENTEDEEVYIDAAIFAQVHDGNEESENSIDEKNCQKSNRKNVSIRLPKKMDIASNEIFKLKEYGDSETENERVSLKRKLRNVTHLKKRLNLADDSDSDYIKKRFITKLKDGKTKVKNINGKNGIIKKKLNHYGKKLLKNAQKCKYCGYLSKNVPNLKRQEQTHTAKKTIPCDVCSKTFALEQYMKTHRARHFNTVRYECDTCHKQFTRLDNMRRHKILHDDFKPYGCELCDFRAPTCDEIMSHVDEHPESIFPCSFCEKRFNQSTYLRNHILTHTHGSANECEICGLSFARDETLTIHKRSHINTRPFPCFVCNRRFSRRHHLEVHSMAHTDERPFACDLCEVRFKHIDTLKKHKRKHEFPKEFRCDLCDKRFVTKAGLKSHKFLHSGDKPFKCDECDKSFIQYKSLLSHRLSHRQEGPFECACCSRAFMTLVAFNKHVEETHKGEPLPELPEIDNKGTVIVREIVTNVITKNTETYHVPKENIPKKMLISRKNVGTDKREDDKTICIDKSQSNVTVEEYFKRDNVLYNSEMHQENTVRDAAEKSKERVEPSSSTYDETKVRSPSNKTVEENIQRIEAKPKKLEIYEPGKMLNHAERTSSYSALMPSYNPSNPTFQGPLIHNNSYRYISDSNHCDSSNDIGHRSSNNIEGSTYNESISNLITRNSKFMQKPLNFDFSNVNEEEVYTEKTNSHVERSLSYLECDKRLTTNIKPISYTDRSEYIDRCLGSTDCSTRPRITISNELSVSAINDRPMSPYSDRSYRYSDRK